MEANQLLEQHYGYFLEFLIVPRATSDTLAELKQVALDLERQPQWVPAQWIDVVWKVATQAIHEAAAADAKKNGAAAGGSVRTSTRGGGDSSSDGSAKRFLILLSLPPHVALS